MKENAPNGIDVYFDNVGGNQLEAAIDVMNLYGRVVMCGMISQYNAEQPMPGPHNLMQIIGKRLLLQGFIVSDFLSAKSEFYENMVQWLKEDKIKVKFSSLKGIENAPQAFIDVLSGQNFGKMLVEI